VEILLTVVNPDDPAPDGLDVAEIDLGDGKIVGVRFDSDEEDVAEAIAKAVVAVQVMGGTIARVFATNGNDAGPPIVGVSEIAEMKGVRRQYASQLGKRRDFPEPICELRGTPVWDTVSVARWLRDEGKNKLGRSGS
jgi:hypothetical protein